jgi:hypothetical protein
MNMENDKSPNADEVLAAVERDGVLHGPLDWVFPAWEIYIEYATRRIAETFPLADEERRQLLGFSEVMRGLLQRAHEQAKAKLTSIHNAVNSNSYRLEGDRLYAPDGTWMHVGAEPYVVIEGIHTVVYFPDVMNLSRVKLELFQLGWEVHEEEEDGRPAYATANPALFMAWAAARFGELHVAVTRALLLKDGAAVEVKATAKSWKRQSRREAEKLVYSWYGPP